MIREIKDWIEQVDGEYLDRQRSCSDLIEPLKDYFPASFLNTAHYVIVDVIPKPNFLALRQLPGLADFLDMQDDAIAYKNTYYIARGFEGRTSLHFHELVHVAQWRCLGSDTFIRRYLDELRIHSYRNAPLELMAYYLQGCYETGNIVNVQDYVDQHL